jgi:hypothetical protein
METASQIISLLENYFVSLDWSYIMTFIIIGYGINHYKVKESLGNAGGKNTRTRYKIVLVGIVYAVILFFLRGYKLPQAEVLLQSFIFAIVFHKLVIEAFVYWMVKKGLPESISKHLLDQEQIKSITDENE